MTHALTKIRPFFHFEFQSMTASTWFDDLLAIKLLESIQSVCLNLIRDMLGRCFAITCYKIVGEGSSRENKGNKKKP